MREVVVISSDEEEEEGAVGGRTLKRSTRSRRAAIPSTKRDGS